MMLRPVCESSWPVGSSARSRSGWLASARAIATRCCSPPDSSCGRWLIRSPKPDQLEQLANALSRSLGSARISRSGTSTFSAADRTGNKPKAWKMKPSLRRRNSMSSDSGKSETVWPSTVSAARRPVERADHRQEGRLARSGAARSATSWPRPTPNVDVATAWTTPRRHGVVARQVVRLDHGRDAGVPTGPLVRPLLGGRVQGVLGVQCDAVAGPQSDMPVAAHPRALSGQTVMWSSSSASRTRRSSPSAST